MDRADSWPAFSSVDDVQETQESSAERQGVRPQGAIKVGTPYFTPSPTYNDGFVDESPADVLH